MLIFRTPRKKSWDSSITNKSNNQSFRDDVYDQIHFHFKLARYPLTISYLTSKSFICLPDLQSPMSGVHDVSS
ncbi:hypothetical protein EYC84_000590 [Monilinia fructicola]|uniref:Uncharacterized protein n=1 Tax=Monilinia fructicola TaxID=38448 RepID=A0A5M9JTY5_MONFR|nr:hypothetical protein EYC84_000590 [Monilinia fructicola]